MKKENLDQRIDINSEFYPPLLKEISVKPKELYMRGNLDLINGKRQFIAVVGTRKSSIYGQKVTRDIANVLVRSGFGVISGLAMGIDAIAQETALELGGDVIAVLAGGIDCSYVRSNQKLFNEICDQGLIISEFPAGTPAGRKMFPRRNRIISGLALATVVIEAGEKSGSLITANFAFAQNRDVYAVPGEIFSNSSQGCHALIAANKAKIICSPEHLIQEITGDGNVRLNFSMTNESLAASETLSEEEQKIINCCNANGNSIEEITMQSGLKLEQVMEILGELEMKFLIGRAAGGLFYKLY
jgi:DNA processing protein